MVSWLFFAHKHEVRETKVLQGMSEGTGTWQAKSSGTDFLTTVNKAMSSTQLDRIFWFMFVYN